MAKRKQSRKHSRKHLGELPGDYGLESLSASLGAIPWPEVKGTAVDIAAAVGAGVAGWVGGELIVTSVPYVKDQSENVKSGVLMGLGVIGGSALAIYGNRKASRPVMMAGLGLGVSMALDGALRIALPLVKEHAGLNMPQMPAMISLNGLRGLGNTRVRERRFAELQGLGRTAAQQEVAVGMTQPRRQFAPDIVAQ